MIKLDTLIASLLDIEGNFRSGCLGSSKNMAELQVRLSLVTNEMMKWYFTNFNSYNPAKY